MNKLIRSGSKLNLKNEDFTFMQDSFLDVLKGMATAYGIGQSDSYVLSGCDFTINAGTISVAAGYIVLGGEICKVDAHSVAQYDANNDPNGYDNFWVIAPTYDASGVRSVEGGGSENTWSVRKGKLILEDTGLNPVRFDMNLKSIHEVGASKMLVAMQSELSQLSTAMPYPTFLNGWAANGLFINKDALGTCIITGWLNGLNATGQNVFKLAAGFNGICYAPTSKDGYKANVIGDDFVVTNGADAIWINLTYKGF